MIKKTMKSEHEPKVSPKEMNVKLLLEAMAVMSLVTGLLLILIPAFLSKIVFDNTPTDPAIFALARITGTAILSIGMICWMVRLEGRSKAGKGLITGLAIYNSLSMMVLAYAVIMQGFSTPGLWTMILIHAVMAGWCIRTTINMKIVSKYQKLF